MITMILAGILNTTLNDTDKSLGSALKIRLFFFAIFIQVFSNCHPDYVQFFQPLNFAICSILFKHSSGILMVICCIFCSAFLFVVDQMISLSIFRLLSNYSSLMPSSSMIRWFLKSARRILKSAGSVGSGTAPAILRIRESLDQKSL